VRGLRCPRFPAQVWDARALTLAPTRRHLFKLPRNDYLFRERWNCCFKASFQEKAHQISLTQAVSVRKLKTPAVWEELALPGPVVITLEAFDAAVFDLDGVITKTASIHAAAWKELFDDYLRARAERSGEPFRPFDAEQDYLRYVDGKPRSEGVKSFLESRGIDLPFGHPDDPPEAQTICGLGNRKNLIFNQRLTTDGVEVYESSVRLVHELRSYGIRIGLVSSSKNTRTVLNIAGLETLFDAYVDGVEAARLSLKGKPHPDTFLHAAKLLGVAPARAFGVEDALSGVQALKAAGYGLVIGVDRANQAGALRDSGADVVVADLAELRLQPPSGRQTGAVERKASKY